MIRKLHILLFSILLCGISVAQNNTNSPYTRYGLGDINNTNAGQLKAMGGVFTAVRTPYAINSGNPASYTAVDSLTFMFDLSAAMQVTYLSTETAKTHKVNGNLDYITLLFPIGHYVAFSAGITPYSSIGYDYTVRDSILQPDNTAYSGYGQTFIGAGGINQVYVGLAGEIVKHLSLGANMYYMWGDITHNRTLQFDNSTYYTTSMNSNLHISDLRFRFGLQAYHTFKDKHKVTLGFAYEFKSKLNGKFSRIEITTADTLDTPSGSFDLPAMYSAGLAYEFDNRLLVSADFTLHQWQKAKYFNVSDTLQNVQRYALGINYRHNPLSKRYIDRMQWRIGAYMQNNYIKQDDSSNFGITFGIGLPLRNSNSMINITAEWNRRGEKYMLREDNFRFTLNANFAEHWFFKRKI